MGSSVRDATNDDRTDYPPIYLNEIEELFESAPCPLMSRIRMAIAVLSRHHVDGREVCPLR
jgi:hypothetical protein